MKNYVDAKPLSPSTKRGYNSIINYFEPYADKPLKNITDWQDIITHHLAPNYAPKTVRNAWRFIKSVLVYHDILPPRNIMLPQLVKNELPWLDAEQVFQFLDCIKGHKNELGMLLALNGLRRSELYAITPSHILVKHGQMYIKVNGAIVFDENHKKVAKKTNKTSGSQRTTPVVVPRLEELLTDRMATTPKSTPFMDCGMNAVWNDVNKICEENDLPLVGVHGLRRSFASLCAQLGVAEDTLMEWGGWSDRNTVHDIYIKMSKRQKEEELLKVKKFYLSVGA